MTDPQLLLLCHREAWAPPGFGQCRRGPACSRPRSLVIELDVLVRVKGWVGVVRASDEHDCRLKISMEGIESILILYIDQFGSALTQSTQIAAENRGYCLIIVIQLACWFYFFMLVICCRCSFTVNIYYKHHNSETRGSFWEVYSELAWNCWTEKQWSGGAKLGYMIQQYFAKEAEGHNVNLCETALWLS